MATTQKHLTANTATSNRHLLRSSVDGHLIILNRSVDSVDVEADPSAQYAARGEYAFQVTSQQSLANMNTNLATARTAYAAKTSWGAGYCTDTASNPWQLPMISGMGANLNPNISKSLWTNNRGWFCVGGVAQQYDFSGLYQTKLCKVTAAKMTLSQCTHGRWDWLYCQGMQFGGWSGTQYTDGGPFVYYYINSELKTPAQAYAAGADGNFSIYSAAQSDFGWSTAYPYDYKTSWGSLDYFGFGSSYTKASATSSSPPYESWTHCPWSIEHEFSLSSTAVAKISAARGSFWLHAWIVSPFVYTSSSSHPGWDANTRDFSSALINSTKLTCAWDT